MRLTKMGDAQNVHVVVSSREATVSSPDCSLLLLCVLGWTSSCAYQHHLVSQPMAEEASTPVWFGAAAFAQMMSPCASALPDKRKNIAERSHAAPGAIVNNSRACAPEGVGQEERPGQEGRPCQDATGRRPSHSDMIIAAGLGRARAECREEPPFSLSHGKWAWGGGSAAVTHDGRTPAGSTWISRNMTTHGSRRAGGCGGCVGPAHGVGGKPPTTR